MRLGIAIGAHAGLVLVHKELASTCLCEDGFDPLAWLRSLDDASASQVFRVVYDAHIGMFAELLCCSELSWRQWG